MQFFCVFWAARFDAVDDGRSAGRPTVVLGGYDGSGSEADVAEETQVCRPTAALEGLVSGYAARTLCAPVTQRYVVKRRGLTCAQASRVARLLFVFVRAKRRGAAFFERCSCWGWGWCWLNTVLLLAMVTTVTSSRCRCARRLLRLLAAGKPLASKTQRSMQPFEYRSVRYWSKEIDGTLTGGRKRIFFNSRSRAPYGP